MNGAAGGMRQAEYSLKKPSELTLAERAAWREFVAADPALGSPYFALEFAQCCEEARSDTRVLVEYRLGMPVAFLAMHVGRIGYARPLAGPLGDVQGAICEPGHVLDVPGALQDLHVPVFNFESVLSSQASFKSSLTSRTGSWTLDLSDGFEAWRSARKSVVPKAIKNLDMRRRRMEKFDGGYSFVMADKRPEAFETMIEWKRSQYQRTKVFDVFSVQWTRRLLEAVLRREGDYFTGLMSTLNIGGEIAAVHVGMASDRVCHYWFPAYSADFGRLSPGLLMIEEMARVSASMGHHSLELGPGNYSFKAELASYQTGLSAGYTIAPSFIGRARQAARLVVERAEAAPLGRLSQWPGKAMRKVDRLVSFHAA